MESLDYWRLCDELTVVQAALLILNIDPGEGSGEYVMGWDYEKRPLGFNAVFAALTAAINSKRLKAKIVHSGEVYESTYGADAFSNWVRDDKPNWGETTIDVVDLKNWLIDRGMKPVFFFPYGVEERSYLDADNQNYAPKLAAAVRAWEIVSNDASLLQGKTPKQAIEKWLRVHAPEFGLTKEDGTHNAQGIDQVAKVANWKPEGGAAKTPTIVQKNSGTPSETLEKKEISTVNKYENDFDDDIPF